MGMVSLHSNKTTAKTLFKGNLIAYHFAISFIQRLD